MATKRRREMRLIDGRCTFNDDTIQGINDLLQVVKAKSNEAFIPLLEAATLQYWSFKKNPNKYSVPAVRSSLADAQAKLDAAAEAVRTVFTLTTQSPDSSPAVARWERHVNEIRRELDTLSPLVDGKRTPKTEEEVLLAKKIGWAIDWGTTAKRTTTTESGLWEQLLILLIEGAGFEAKNTHRIILDANSDM